MSTDFGPFWSWNMMLILIRFRNSPRKGMQRIFISTWFLVGHTKSVGASCTSSQSRGNCKINMPFLSLAMQQNDVLCKNLKLVFESWKPLQSSSLSPHPWWFETCFLFMSIWDDPIWQLNNWIDLKPLLPDYIFGYSRAAKARSQQTCGNISKFAAHRKGFEMDSKWKSGRSRTIAFRNIRILDYSTKSAVELNILRWTENLQERFKIDASKFELWKFRRTWIRQAVKDKIEVRSQKSFWRGHGKMLGDVETNCGLKNWTASIWKNYHIIMSSCLFLSLSKVLISCLV